MNTLYSFASTAIRKKCKTLQKKIQISFCTEININLVKRHWCLIEHWCCVSFHRERTKSLPFGKDFVCMRVNIFLVLFAFLFCLDNAFYRFNAVNGTHKRMIKHNSRSGIAHNLFYFWTHIGFVAMAGTLRAEVFIVSPAAMIKPEKRIISKFLAFLAKSSFFWFMHTVAINFYHFG